MQNPDHSPVPGPLASPSNRNNRARRFDLSIRKMNLDHDLESMVTVNEDGRVDVDVTVELGHQYNHAIQAYEDEADLLTIVADGASRVDVVIHDMVGRIIIHSGVDDWNHPSETGLIHTGRYAGFTLHFVARFGALTLQEIYRLCGQVYGGKAVCYAVQKLVSHNYLDKFRIEGSNRAQYQLGPMLAHDLPVSGTRSDRDAVAFEAALEAGREVINTRGRALANEL